MYCSLSSGDDGAKARLGGVDAVNLMRLRDIRRLEYQFGAPNEPTVLAKKHSVLFIMDPVRYRTYKHIYIVYLLYTGHIVIYCY